MTMHKQLADQGDFLFRWRSFLPLLLLLPGSMALADSALFEARHSSLLADLWVLVGFVISLLGLCTRWVTVGFVPAGTSGRNTSSQRAARLNTRGMYSVVRNPLYLGNYLALLGILVSLKVWWFVLVGCLAYWLYIERIIAAEERYLGRKFGDAYAAWAERTPVFLPNFRLWLTPDMRFSCKTVLRREYNGFMTVCSAFFLTELVVDVVFEHEPVAYWLAEDWIWVLGFGFATVTFVTLRNLKRHTGLLRVAGR